MRHILQISLIIIFTNCAFAQCPNSDKLKFGGWFGTTTFPRPSATQYFSYDLDTTQFCCKLSKIQKYADFIINKSKAYIKERGGDVFYDKLKFHDIMITYYDSTIFPNFNKMKYDLQNCGKITYWLTYSYFLNSKTEYGFGMEFDSNGNRISNHMFPDISANPHFMNIIKLCDALKVQSNQKNVKFDSVESIELNYDNEENTFIWLIKEGYSQAEGTHEQDVLFINANTGKLYKTKKEVHTIME